MRICAYSTGPYRTLAAHAFRRALDGAFLFLTARRSLLWRPDAPRRSRAAAAIMLKRIFRRVCSGGGEAALRGTTGRLYGNPGRPSGWVFVAIRLGDRSQNKRLSSRADSSSGGARPAGAPYRSISRRPAASAVSSVLGPMIPAVFFLGRWMR